MSILNIETLRVCREREQKEGVNKILQKIHGIDNVDEEFQDLIDASEEAKKVEHSWKNITQLRHKPQLTYFSLIPFFHLLTCINVIMFYAPVLFKTLGFGNNAPLMSAVITGGVNVLATFFSIFTVDKFGRNIFFLEGGVQMFICQIIVGSMIAIKFRVSGEGSFTHIEDNLLLFFIYLYVSHLHGLGVHWDVSFVIIMTIFIVMFFPETNNVPIEEMNKMWKSHWFWKNFVLDVVVD
ncbi:unnamed protein product [Vicia faba]|uniref:Uncharacterized protein n=1 Tax=Vicia faba TaxID=3906 RepID=A0AAV0Z1Z9_VICFA|nr:unnamed protein product [Vicia faba]